MKTAYFNCQKPVIPDKMANMFFTVRCGLLLTFTVFSFFSVGWEVDNISCGFKKLSDASPTLNAETNLRIQKAVEAYNSKVTIGDLIRRAGIYTGAMKSAPRKRCDLQVLEYLRSAMASAWFGNLETWAEDANIDKCLPSESEMVYRHVRLADGKAITVAGMHSVININGIYTGADKLSHFMTEGYSFYREFLRLKETDPQNQSRHIATILPTYTQEEEGIYGWAMTGVKSYGDLSANYAGFTFWRQMIDGANPYLKCENDKWVIAREFRWQDFVNRSFDESINCNSFSDRRMEAAVQLGTQQILKRNGFTSATDCPLDPNKCVEVRNVFRDPALIDVLVSPLCRGGAREYRWGPNDPPPTAPIRMMSIPIPDQNTAQP